MAVTIEAGPPFASQGISLRYDARAEMLKGSTSGRRNAWSGPRPIISICWALRPDTPLRALELGVARHEHLALLPGSGTPRG